LAEASDACDLIGAIGHPIEAEEIIGNKLNAATARRATEHRCHAWRLVDDPSPLAEVEITPERFEPLPFTSIGARFASRPWRKASAASAVRRRPEAVSRSLGVTAATLSGWRDAFLVVGEASLTTRPEDGASLEHERLKARLGEMLLERELLEAKIAAMKGKHPLARPEVEAMSRTLSPSSGKPYGLAGVCRARATVYRHRLPLKAEPPQRPGPVRPNAHRRQAKEEPESERRGSGWCGPWACRE
jgi:transposase-like protein